MPASELDWARSGATVGPALARGFFARPSPVVARELLGCLLVCCIGAQAVRVRVTETEAYLGSTDPASHAYRGRTQRNAPMFGMAGIAYVYFVYGMHHCFNVVTGQEGDPQALLIRAAEGESWGGQSRLSGPARLCRALGIDRSYNGLDLCRPGFSPIWFEPGSATRRRVVVTPRVGVRDQSPLRFLFASAELPQGGSGPSKRSEPRRARSF